MPSPHEVNFRHQVLYEDQLPTVIQDPSTYMGLIVLCNIMWKVLKMWDTGKGTAFRAVPVYENSEAHLTVEAIILKLTSERMSEEGEGSCFSYEFQDYKYKDHTYDERDKVYIIIAENLK